MDFQGFTRQVIVGSLITACAFVAINTTGVASATYGDREKCTMWYPLKGGGTVKVCATAIEKSVIGKAVLGGGAKLNKNMFIDLLTASGGDTITYENGKNEIIARNLPPGDYQVAFCERVGITCFMSPVVSVS